jgi:hypothetical protein
LGSSKDGLFKHDFLAVFAFVVAVEAWLFESRLNDLS